MGTARKRPRRRSQTRPDRSPTTDAEPSRRIERLRRDFARFRRTHPLRTRIPDPLRSSALAALQAGEMEADVRRACGVTSDQLAQWAKPQQAGAPRQARASQQAAQLLPPRVFPVVDDAAAAPDGREAEPEPLELRLGGWSISVRPCRSSGGCR
jgi:hypothetical protein